MYELTIKGHFCSAHSLRGHKGGCENLHGHTWKIEVVIQSEQLDAIGMVVDFKKIKKQLNDFLGHIDHVYLNELPLFKEINPTTENLAKYIFGEFSKRIKPLAIKKVTVWESDTSSVTYYQ